MFTSEFHDTRNDAYMRIMHNCYVTVKHILWNEENVCCLIFGWTNQKHQTPSVSDGALCTQHTHVHPRARTVDMWTASAHCGVSHSARTLWIPTHKQLNWPARLHDARVSVWPIAPLMNTYFQTIQRRVLPVGVPPAWSHAPIESDGSGHSTSVAIVHERTRATISGKHGLTEVRDCGACQNAVDSTGRLRLVSEIT